MLLPFKMNIQDVKCARKDRAVGGWLHKTPKPEAEPGGAIGFVLTKIPQDYGNITSFVAAPDERSGKGTSTKEMQRINSK